MQSKIVSIVIVNYFTLWVICWYLCVCVWRFYIFLVHFWLVCVADCHPMLSFAILHVLSRFSPWAFAIVLSLCLCDALFFFFTRKAIFIFPCYIHHKHIHAHTHIKRARGRERGVWLVRWMLVNALEHLHLYFSFKFRLHLLHTHTHTPPQSFLHLPSRCSFHSRSSIYSFLYIRKKICIYIFVQ